MKNSFFALALGLAGWAVAGSAMAATWYVDATRAGYGATGQSWETAYATLDEALAVAGDGDEIAVAPGSYGPVRLATDDHLVVRSSDGAAHTFLSGDGVGRCAELLDAGGHPAKTIVLEGFTLRDGWDDSELGGGGVLGGQLLNSVLTDNYAAFGGGASCAELENCLLAGNAAEVSGGGAIASLLLNCTVADNTAASAGGGTVDCDLYNSIVWGNDAVAGADVSGGTAAYTCAGTPLEGEGNFVADPEFVDAAAGDYRLSAGSAGVDAGDADMVGDARALEGGVRQLGASVDLGAYEGAYAPVVLDAVGGTVSPSVVTCAVETLGEDLPVPVREGFVFDGWVREVPADSSASTWPGARSAKAAATSRLKLAASWKAVVKVTFDANGGTCSPLSGTYTVGQAFGTLPTPKRSGNRFIGWYTASRGGTRVTASTKVSQSLTTLYVHWARLLTVKFDANGGSCALASKQYAVNYTYHTLPTPQRSGYRFMGWYTAAKGGTKVVASTIVSASVPTLYAHWARLVTVKFDANGGSCALASKQYAASYTYGSLPTPKRSGNRFMGWYTAVRGGTRIRTTSKVSTSVTTLYAHWARLVTVNFHGNGGTVAATSKQFPLHYTYGSFPKVSRSGYKCAGWFTAANGGQKITVNSNVTTSVTDLYARWGKPVTVTFKPNGGTCSTSSKVYAVGFSYFSLPKPTRSGYTFQGWYTAASGGTRVTAATVATAARTVLYARWKCFILVHAVGDSMTYGARTRSNPLLSHSDGDVSKISNQGWRGYLKQKLDAFGNEKGYTFKFVGTHPESSISGNVPHDGYCGEMASAYASRHSGACSTTANFQIVLLGMNDALHMALKGDTSAFSATRSGISSVMSRLNSSGGTFRKIIITEPGVTSLVTQHNSAYNASAINTVIGHYINPYVRSLASSSVTVVDIESLYRSNGGYTDDGFHFSVSGNQALADKLYNTIRGAL